MSKKEPPSRRPERQEPGSILIVGKPYIPSRRHWDEAADYNFRDGGHELRIFIPNATPAEVAAAREGRVEFGLIVDLPEIYVISRYFDPGDPARMIMSFDCSYSIHRVSPEGLTAPPAWRRRTRRPAPW